MAQSLLQIRGETNGRVVQVKVKGKDHTVNETKKDVFCVQQGRECFIVAKGKSGKAVESFVIQPPNTGLSGDLKKEHLFCYKLQSAERKHAGLYKWEATCNGSIYEDGKFEIVVVAGSDDQCPDSENDETLAKQRLAMPFPVTSRLDPQGAVGHRPQVEVQPNLRETPYNLRQRQQTPSPNLHPIPNHLNGPTVVSSPRQHTPQVQAACQTRLQARQALGCTLPLDHWFSQCYSYQQITDLVKLADPTTHGESRCWIGLGLGAAHIPRCDLENFEYHHRGSVGHGPMRKVLEIMKSNGQSMQDIVHYFSQHQNRRVDIMRHIQSFHSDCPVCSPYYNM
ncbi:hypothetical protein CHS0354_003573 [Potamilus streckersoni]|uniref:Uncharacterized protein n=1 Tax=Potamilus streckersoni TaxID=2493646 RepID=A0AAE0SMG7_9BIVA|nr:hypothetical protein CHS0354_003573 [Potamilus streckersoni]